MQSVWQKNWAKLRGSNARPSLICSKSVFKRVQKNLAQNSKDAEIIFSVSQIN